MTPQSSEPLRNHDEDRPMLICEELFLLLTTNAGKAVASRSTVRTALAAAAVADTVEAGRVDLTADRNPRVVVVNTTPTGILALDTVLPRLAFKSGRSATATVSDRQICPDTAIVDRLRHRGVIGSIAPRWAGLVPAQYPIADSTLVDVVRARLRAGVLGAPLAWRDATLLGLVAASGATRSTFSLLRGEIGTAKLERRLDEISRHIPLAQAVRAARRNREANEAVASTLLLGGTITS